MRTWFTSDNHFLHARINELSSRPFSSVEEHDAELIRRHNEVVGKNDSTWFLGDFALGNRDKALSYLPMMNGRKYLIIGNHDECFPFSKDGWKKTRKYLDAGFEVVLPAARIRLPSLVSGEKGREVLLSHFPYDRDHVGTNRHMQARLRDEGDVLVHGHVHGEYKVDWSDKGSLQVNVGVDAWDYTPVSSNTIAQLVKQELDNRSA